MATRHDRQVVARLLKVARRYRRKLDMIETKASKGLSASFRRYVRQRRAILNRCIDTLQKTGPITNNSPQNKALILKCKRDLEELVRTIFRKGGPIHRELAGGLKSGGRLGTGKALDTYRLGEGPVPKRSVAQAKAADEVTDVITDNSLRALTNREQLNVADIRTAMVGNITDVTGTTASLRASISPHLDGMLDTLGRRVTPDERADRVAKYELHRAFTEAQTAQVKKLYPGIEDGDEWYMWDAVLDSRTAADSLRRHGQVLTKKQWATKDFGDRWRGLAPLRPRDRCDNIFTRPEWFSPEMRKKHFNADNQVEPFDTSSGVRKRAA